MLEKKRIIQSRGARISLRRRMGPREKLIAVRVVIANRKIAFTA
jgi:hypothetical protein